MKVYWPCAIRICQDGKTDNLFTYDSCLSMQKALQAIRTWRDAYGFELARCWVEIYEDGVKLKTETVISDEI